MTFKRLLEQAQEKLEQDRLQTGDRKCSLKKLAKRVETLALLSLYLPAPKRLLSWRRRCPLCNSTLSLVKMSAGYNYYEYFTCDDPACEYEYAHKRLRDFSDGDCAIKSADPGDLF